MATYNSIPGLSTGASSNDPMAMNLGTGQTQGLGIDVFDQELTFDESLLDGATLQNLPFTPSYDLETFSTTFEDPFSYSSRQFESTPNPDVLHEEESPQELDNKLLGFSAPVASATVIDETGQFSETGMSAELYGMFFVAEDVFGGETTGRPLELTCYRRNLWQCSGQIVVPRIITNIVNEQGIQVQIFELVATITSTESIEGKPTEIISIPWKNATAPPGEESKVIGAPPNITLDLSSAQEVDANRVSMPISWKRLQFKHATANNGRRKGLQQHYVVRIGLHGKTKSGDLIQIAEIQSGPVIVRGRSPRNFDNKKDVPLTTDKRVERRNTATPDPSAVKIARENSQAYMQRFNSLGNISVSSASYCPPEPGCVLTGQQTNDWSTSTSMSKPIPSPQLGQNPHPAKRMAISSNAPRPPVPAWSTEPSHPIKHQTTQNIRGSISRQGSSLPINLSLSEDERSPNRSGSDLQSPQPGKANAATGQNTENSPSEDADPLYEYFPLTVDDWYDSAPAILTMPNTNRFQDASCRCCIQAACRPPYYCPARDESSTTKKQGEAILRT
ncbi:hypothetical protein EDB81DRAFT_13805 [Dactylonectria macrodidyma]|uniref:NDT80 domain-containing protein n=1 Tax=Dactylonectria macrodidyma TaxID=307937 RepID=A0A9P9JQS8_9HYPO|nr:hypothetical protein EDB81DRAFT_13805 [Dactylonectria macrodidyma]